VRQRYTPVDISGGGITVTFSVIPELPAISRASLTVQVVADTVALGFLRMSAPNARVFLTELRDGRSPIVAEGDEGGTVEIDCVITDVGPVFLVRKPGERHTLHRRVIGPDFDLKTLADELLADLGP
jgi:hypothetical protein